MDLENIVVDITQRNYNTIQTIQYDVDSRYVNVKIVNSGKNVDLTNYMVSIACKKPDGKIVFNETEMVEPKQGLIKFLISEQISSTLGEVVCELKIYGKNSSVLTTQYFTINVTQPIADKTIQSTNEFRQLTIAMNEYNAWISKVEDKYNGLEEEYAEELTSVSGQVSELEKKISFKLLQSNLISSVYKKIVSGESFSICCYGDSLTYGTDNWSSDKIKPSTDSIPDGSVHTETRGSNQYPSVLEQKLNEVYGAGKVTVTNRGYGGDYVERALTRWLPGTNPAGTDICIMGYGTNDSRSPGCPYAGDVERFLTAYRKLIEIELLNGSAIILMSPPKMRRGDDVSVQSFDIAVKHLAKEYGLPVIVGDELLSNYSVEFMSDQTHPNGLGYEVMGSLIASCFIGNGIFDMVKVTDSSTLLTRKQIDSIYFNSNVAKISSQYYETPQEVEVDKGIAIQLTAGNKATYSFYAEKELIVIPCINMNFDDSIAKLTLDFGIKQASKSFTTHPDYKYNVQDRSILPSTVQYNKSNSGSASRIFLKEIIENELDTLTIAKKGWHTVTVEAVANRISFSGLLFLPVDHFEFISKYGGTVERLSVLETLIVGDENDTKYRSIRIERNISENKYRASVGVVTKSGTIAGVGIALNENGVDVARLDIDKSSVGVNEDNVKDLGKPYYRFKDIYATNGVIQTSDLNAKKDIIDTDLGLDFINNLRPVDFKFKEGQSNRVHTGFIAQEVEEVLGDNDKAMLIKTKVTDENTGEEQELYSLRYNEIIAPLVKAVQELSREVEELKAKHKTP